MPSAAGDSAHDLVVSSSTGDATVVPVVLRSLVSVNRHGGTFDGTLLGGNGRQFVAQTDTFEFNVPKHRKALSVSLSWPNNAGTEVAGWLIDPDGTLLGSTPLQLAPGQSGTITVTFTPQGRKGDKVDDILYVDDFGQRFLAGNEQFAFPYSYRIK
jgi:hypothetical protein